MTNIQQCTVKIKITKTQQHEVEVQLPYYCKDSRGIGYFYKVISRDTAIQVENHERFKTSISETDTAAALGEFRIPIEEGEFIAAYEEAQKKLSTILKGGVS